MRDETNAIPDRPEVDVDTGHEYDGIRELDNRLPNWWLFTLYGTVAFSVAYWLYYHSFEIGPTQAERLAFAREERQKAMLAKSGPLGDGAIDDAGLEKLAHDAEIVARGREVFQQTCISCHGEKAQGLVGPNLTDDHWIHGGRPTDIYRLIGEGKLEKGMPSWRDALGPKKLQEVTAFVLSLRGSNVPGKAPEGQPWPPVTQGGGT